MGHEQDTSTQMEVGHKADDRTIFTQKEHAMMRTMVISKMSTMQCRTQRQTAYYVMPSNWCMTTVDNKLRQTMKVVKSTRHRTRTV